MSCPSLARVLPSHRQAADYWALASARHEQPLFQVAHGHEHVSHSPGHILSYNWSLFSLSLDERESI